MTTKFDYTAPYQKSTSLVGHYFDNIDERSRLELGDDKDWESCMHQASCLSESMIICTNKYHMTNVCCCKATDENSLWTHKEENGSLEDMTYSLPRLRRCVDSALRQNMYMHACICIISGVTPLKPEHREGLEDICTERCWLWQMSTMKAYIKPPPVLWAHSVI